MVNPTKLRFSLKITLLIIIFLFNLSAQAKYGGGTGESNNPYLIYTPEQMNTIGAEPNDWDKHFKLMADIDLSAYIGTSFNIIGHFQESSPGRQRSGVLEAVNQQAFSGIFDGNNHVISNFFYSSSNVNGIGLFRSVSGEYAEIKNLTLLDPNVSGAEGISVGALIGVNSGKIINCYVEGSIVSSAENIGGLVGSNSGTIINCYIEGDKISGSKNVGGLVGSNSGSITTSYSNVSVESITNAGGLVGSNFQVSSSISNCYSTGDVSGEIVGGLVGSNIGNIINCYSTGLVTGDTTGGLVGNNWNWENVHASFWDTQTSGQLISNGGTGKTTPEMKTASTFIPWESDAVWTIEEGVDYPRLWWQYESGVIISDNPFGFGNGSENNPYLIFTAEQMNTIGAEPNEWDKHFKLMADIDLSAYTETDFNIIGHYISGDSFDNKPFSGVFNGNDHTVSNFSYTCSDRNCIGLFGYISEEQAKIRDLGLITSNIDANDGSNIGLLVGYIEEGNIVNCYVDSGSVVGGAKVGGLGVCRRTSFQGE